MSRDAFWLTLLSAAVAVALILAVLFWQPRPRCPEGQVQVLSDDKWVCVKRGD